MSLKVKADIRENRLYFKLSGKARKEELDKLYTDVRFLVADLTPGFDVISDYSECDFSIISGKWLNKISNYLVTNGLGEVVRVISGNSLLYDQAKNLSTISNGFRPIYARSHEEAKGKLEATVKRNSIRFYVNDLQVEYTSKDKYGKCKLLNISTGGCSAQSATMQLSIDEDILMTISFENQDTSKIEFKAKARVIRTEKDTFGAKFSDLGNDQKELLWKCLISESQRE
ncbi:MAG: PilZ domain-containing protein [Chlorobium sp.]|jgi:hypothetical protein|nr:PilZ domain-containing protein [Chlorobium sp.]